MPSPFPGMNPYLEHPALWSSFHFRLVSAVLSRLDQVLPSHYYTEIKTQTYQVLEGSEEDEEGQWVRNHPAANPAHLPYGNDRDSGSGDSSSGSALVSGNERFTAPCFEC
jgi:hypothetical protein